MHHDRIWTNGVSSRARSGRYGNGVIYASSISFSSFWLLEDTKGTKQLQVSIPYRLCARLTDYDVLGAFGPETYSLLRVDV